MFTKVIVAIFNELYIGASGHSIGVNGYFNPSFPDPGRNEKIESCIKIKINLIFIFTLLCVASKGFMKTLKAFIKRFETQQGSVKVKIKLIFIYYNFLKCTGLEELNDTYILIFQKFWKHGNGNPVLREEMIAALAGIDSFLLRASYSTDMIESR